jgi:hypothetical protein
MSDEPPQTTQLRLWFDWCEKHHLEPLTDVRRPHVELCARDLEARGLAAATVALKLVVLTAFYRDCVEEQLLEHSPAVHVRRPKVSQGSTRLGLDRTVPNLTDLARANGHRVVRIVGKGNRPALIRWHHAPREPSTLPSVSAPTGHCSHAPTAADWTVTQPGGSCADRRNAPGSTSPSRPTRCGTPRSPLRSWPGAACATCRTSHGTLTLARPAATTVLAARSTATPPASSRPTKPEPPAPGDLLGLLPRLPREHSAAVTTFG